jgi:hypothetical protein
VYDKDVRALAYLLAVVLAGLGLLFVVAAGSGNAAVRFAVGVVLIGAAGLVVYLVRVRPVIERKEVVVHQNVQLSGDVRPENLVCQQCGARLEPGSVKVEAGAVFIACGYCGGRYQLEEAPKW